MSLGNTCVVEHIEELKTQINYQTRVYKRLKEDIETAQNQVDSQLELMDSLNGIFQDNKKSSYTSSKSPFVATLKKITYNNNEHKIPKTTFATPKLTPLLNSPRINNENPEKKHFYESLANENDFESFFLDNPIVLNYLIKENVENNSEEINKFVEKLPFAKRMEYFKQMFRQMNEASQIFTGILSIVNSSSFSQLSDKIESRIPPLLNVARAAFFHVTGKSIVLEKRVMNLARNFTSGAIYNAWNEKSIAIVSKDSPEFNYTDEAILGKNETVLIIPTDATLFLLFDKRGGFTTYDFLIAKGINMFLTELIPSLEQTETKNPLVASCISIIHNFNPKTLAEFFNCQAARVFHITRDNMYYDAFSEKQERFNVSRGIVGQSISKRRSIRIDNPEFSVLFDPLVDRITNDTVSSSILVCPIFDEDNNVKWAVALYSREDIDFFTEHDETALKMICKSLNPIVRMESKSKKLKKTIERKEKYIQFLIKISDLFLKQIDIRDLSTVNSILSNATNDFINASLEISTIDVFRNHIQGILNEIDEEIDSESDNPVISLASQGEIVQHVIENQGVNVYVPIKGSNDDNVALLQLQVEQQSTKNHLASSIYSSISFFSLDSSKTESDQLLDLKSLSSTKSTLQIKYEKMVSNKNVKTKRVENKYANTAKIFRSFIGPYIESSRIFQDDSYAGYFAEEVSKHSDNYKFVFNAYEDQATLIGAAPIGDSTFIPVPINKEEYQKATAELFIALADVCGFPEQTDHGTVYPSIIPSLPQMRVDFDVFNESGEKLLLIIASLIDNEGCEDSLGLSSTSTICALKILRSMHSSNWEICVDNAQYAYYNSCTLKIGSTIERIAMIFYLLIRDSNKIEETGATVQAIETGQAPKASTILLYATSNANIETSDNKDWDKIFNLLDRFEEMESYDIFSDDTEPIDFLCIVSTRSSLGRTNEIAKKYIEKRFGNDEDKMMAYILETEMRCMIIPMLTEMETKKVRTRQIRNSFIENVKEYTNSLL